MGEHMTRPLGVGIIGLSAHGGWASRAHLPALRAMDGFAVRGLAASDDDAARRAGERYGVGIAVSDPGELARHPDIDLVVIAVRVPRHAELVEAVVKAGTPILCEWPLAVDLAEAERLAGLAADAGVTTAVGLQARNTPTVRFVRDRIADGYLGRVLSSTLVGSGGGWTDGTTSGSAYTMDRANGATMLTIPFGHTLDAVTSVLGPLAHVSATTAVLRPEVTVADTGDTLTKTAADQIAVTGEFRGGAVFAAHYRAGSTAGTTFLWEINGTDGVLQLRGPSGHLQFDQAEVFGARGGEDLAPLPVPDRYSSTPGTLAPGTPPRSVAHAYLAFRRDLADGTHLVPTFADAVGHHRLLHAIERSAERGTRLRVP